MKQDKTSKNEIRYSDIPLTYQILIVIGAIGTVLIGLALLFVLFVILY